MFKFFRYIDINLAEDKIWAKHKFFDSGLVAET